MRILIAEDDSISRYALQKLLTPYGNCHSVATGKLAVEAFQKSLESDTAYDLVCLDILMPELDGHGALREMRTFEEAKGIRFGYGAKIIMVSALGDMKNVMNAYHGLCDGYLAKPISRNSVVQVLKELKLISSL